MCEISRCLQWSIPSAQKFNDLSRSGFLHNFLPAGLASRPLQTNGFSCHSTPSHRPCHVSFWLILKRACDLHPRLVRILSTYYRDAFVADSIRFILQSPSRKGGAAWRRSSDEAGYARCWGQSHCAPAGMSACYRTLFGNAWPAPVPPEENRVSTRRGADQRIGFRN
jgi:hypothetical protein